MKRGASGDGSPVGDQELVLPYPALNIRFGVSFVIVSFVSVVLGMLAAVCLWLVESTGSQQIGLTQGEIRIGTP